MHPPDSSPPAGIDLDTVEFDQHGAMAPLTDADLDGMAGGLAEHPNGNCEFNANC